MDSSAWREAGYSAIHGQSRAASRDSFYITQLHSLFLVFQHKGNRLCCAVRKTLLYQRQLHILFLTFNTKETGSAVLLRRYISYHGTFTTIQCTVTTTSDTTIPNRFLAGRLWFRRQLGRTLWAKAGCGRRSLHTCVGCLACSVLRGRSRRGRRRGGCRALGIVWWKSVRHVCELMVLKRVGGLMQRSGQCSGHMHM